MKLFFDPIKNQPDAVPLDKCVAVDMQLEELLHSFMQDRDMEAAAAKTIMSFCSDGDIIRYRQSIVGDLIKNDAMYEMFCKLCAGLSELKVLFEMNMFSQIPETKSLKTFLVTEKFADIYTTLSGNAEKLPKAELSAETAKISADILDESRIKELRGIKEDIDELRTALKQLEQIRFNRFFSRGQNIENSIIAATDEESVTSGIAHLAQRLGLDTAEASVPALQSSRELTRPVFLALYKAYPDVFERIEKFHAKYADTFDTAWLDLIPKLHSAIGLALMYRRLQQKGFAIAKAEIADTTDVTGLYSFFLVDRGLSPEEVVSNDYKYSDGTSFFFIMGPNAGGKTIYLSSVGLCQLFFQACGYVPAQTAKIKVMKRMFTHFPVEEYNDNSGRLVEEQGRVEKIFESVTDSDCLALFNETYSSTKADIAYKMSVELCENVRKHNVAGIFVTHLHSLKDYSKQTSDKSPHIGALTAMKDEKTGKRTYKIVPISDQNSSFAKDILEKYDMTVDQMLQRIKAKKEGRNNA